jgi:CheY-like chemotaxis protein
MARILIVDDDAPQRRSLALGLRLLGFSTLEAASGEEALGLLDVQRVDLAIVDLMMPGVNGLQLVRRLAFRHRGLPVVLTSGYHLGRRQLERVGVNAIAFVPKPFKLEELAEFLRQKLRQESEPSASSG